MQVLLESNMFSEFHVALLHNREHPAAGLRGRQAGHKGRSAA
jgi:hypothetical protein